ncbi:MAG TPA: protein-tyrosine phosphatase family protein [Streptosporangiaceae bacterium]
MTPATEPWDPAAPGVLRLPSGRLVRGRGLRHPVAPSQTPAQTPALGIYLLGRPPAAVPWESRWLRWPDFRLPADPDQVRRVLTEAWRRSATERVEVACAGGRGRTGTALACLAILDGVAAAQAVTYVRTHYDRRAVETPGQRRFVTRWTPA